MFECVANGSESLTISWGRNVETSSRLKISNEITNSGRRSILKVKKSRIADSGSYWCIATNADNEVVSSEPAELLSKIMSITCKIISIMQFYHQYLQILIMLQY